MCSEINLVLFIGGRCRDWEWKRGVGREREGSEGECD